MVHKHAYRMTIRIRSVQNYVVQHVCVHLHVATQQSKQLYSYDTACMK